ncbi:hypothetical protein TNCV_1109481 [Trichonephila clavipes]|nr:hypothetical protein TNCV_1109481 [Trichonephila clavipes]
MLCVRKYHVSNYHATEKFLCMSMPSVVGVVRRQIWKLGSGISRQIWKWEIVDPDDPDQDNGTKLLNYCIVIAILDECAKFELIKHFKVGKNRVQWVIG